MNTVSSLLIRPLIQPLNVYDVHTGGNSMTLDNDEELFDSPSRVLTLTRNEALYLDDSLTMMLETAQGDVYSTMRPLTASAQLPAPVDLIEKIANAVLYTLDIENRGQEAEILVNDGDLYCLRELAQSYVRVGDEPVGFNLKKKNYTALFGTEYNLGRHLEDVLEGFTSQANVSMTPTTEDEKF